MNKHEGRGTIGIVKYLAFTVCLLVIFSCSSFSETLGSSDLSLEQMTQDLFAEHPNKSGAYVLEKGEEALLTRAWLAEQASKSIDVQYFIWSTDNIGILAAEALLQAAQRGTRVRVIVDDFLIDAPDESMLALSAHPNIDIKIYNPKNSVGVSSPERVFKLIGNFRSFNQRMHDKTFIVDGLVAITGGRNMADEYFDYDHDYNFRDRDIILLGPVVTEMKKSFEKFWNSEYTAPVETLLEQKKKKLSNERIAEIYTELHAYSSNPENFAHEVRQVIEEIPEQIPLYAKQLIWEDIVFVADDPGKNKSSGFRGGGKSTEKLVEAVRDAKKSILIQSPYLVIPSGGISFFKKLIDQGVEITINTNSLASTDNLQAFSGYSKQRAKILEAGIQVYEFRPKPDIQKELIGRYEELEKNVPTFAIHAKTMVIDSELLFLGTFNLDPRSANLNTETGVLIRNRELAGQVEKNIRRDMLPENSWNAATDNPDEHAPLNKRLKISFWKILPIKSIL